MKRIFVLLLAMFLIACSADNDNNNNEQNDEVNNSNNNTEENEEASETPGVNVETIFTYDHESAGEYGIQSVQVDQFGESVVFTGNEDIDRKTDYHSMIINKKGEAINTLEFALDEEQDRRCTGLYISQSGDYLVYNCHDDDIEFSVYDMNKDEIITQVEEFDEYISDIIGISDDGVVFLEALDDDNDLEIILYDTNSDSKEHLAVEKLIDNDDYNSFEDIVPANNGEQFFVYNGSVIYLLDAATESLETIVDSASYEEEHDAEMYMPIVTLSQDAKYIYYRMISIDSDLDFIEHNFVQLDSGEKTVFEEFNYSSIRGFDEDGNALLATEEEFHLYNLASGETRVVPDIEISTYTSYATFAHNGESFIYTDKESNDDGTYTQYLYRVELGDTSSFETIELEASAEAAEVEEEEVEEGSISLTEETLGEKADFEELWESSTNILFPTEIPGEIEEVTNHYSGDEDNRSYLQTLFIDTDSSKGDEIKFRARPISSTGSCSFFDDLDVVETDGGHEYLFYDYRNKDVESAVSIDDFCYYFEAEDHTEEDMIKLAKSLEPVDQPYHELSVEDLLFPSKFTIKDPRTSNPRVISYKGGEKVDFLIDYRGDEEDDIKMELEIRNSEPTFFAEEKYSVALDVDQFDEAYFLEDYMRLHLYNGDYYYLLDLDIDDEEIKSFGIDHILEVATEIANSFE